MHVNWEILESKSKEGNSPELWDGKAALSLHLQEVYKSVAHKAGDFPESERAQGQVLFLPMYPELGEEQVIAIAEAIKRFKEKQSE